EAEADAELLPEGEPPRLVDARAEWRVHDELHAAALVEEALEDDAFLRRHGAEARAALLHELGDLARARLGERLAADLAEVCDAGDVGERGLLAYERDLGRELARSTRSLAEPEGQRRRRALGVRHAHGARLDAQHAPGGVPELEDVSARRLDLPVLVDRADERAFGLEEDAVVRRVGDRPARQQRGQLRALRAHEA